MKASLDRGCKSLAIVDLKEEEAQKAAAELKAEFGMFFPTSHAHSCSSAFILRPWLHFSEENGTYEKGALNVIGVGCDVSSEVSVQKAFKVATDEFGRIDSVVASAGESTSRLALTRLHLISFNVRARLLTLFSRIANRYRRELFCV